MAFHHKFREAFTAIKMDKDYMFESVNQKEISNAIHRKPGFTKKW